MFYLHFLIQPLQETQDLRHNKKSMSVNPNLFVCVRTRVCVCVFPIGFPLITQKR